MFSLQLLRFDENTKVKRQEEISVIKMASKSGKSSASGSSLTASSASTAGRARAKAEAAKIRAAKN